MGMDVDPPLRRKNLAVPLHLDKNSCVWRVVPPGMTATFSTPLQLCKSVPLSSVSDTRYRNDGSSAAVKPNVTDSMSPPALRLTDSIEISRPHAAKAANSAIAPMMCLTGRVYILATPSLGNLYFMVGYYNPLCGDFSI